MYQTTAVMHHIKRMAEHLQMVWLASEWWHSENDDQMSLFMQIACLHISVQ